MLKVPNVCKIRRYLPVADPGFPRAWGANSRGGGAPTYDFAKFPQKLHEIERIWTPGGEGARPKFYYVDPPLPPPLFTWLKDPDTHITCGNFVFILATFFHLNGNFMVSYNIAMTTQSMCIMVISSLNKSNRSLESPAENGLKALFIIPRYN